MHFRGICGGQSRMGHTYNRVSFPRSSNNPAGRVVNALRERNLNGWWAERGENNRNSEGARGGI